MDASIGTRLFIDRKDLKRLRFAPDPDARRPLAEGQVRLAIEQFALTANNITYAAFGEAMKYWQFFPAAEPHWGCLPVWGFATVVESLAAGVDAGQRAYGCYPAGSHAVLTPARAGAAGFVDASPHRQELAAAYRQYVFCEHDPFWLPQREGLQATFKPLFFTSFLIDDFLAENGWFSASLLLLSSASSKTAYGTAFCLAQRRGAGGPRVVGLTSPGNLDFTRSLGCYDAVLPYAELTTLDAADAAVYVDLTGDAALRRQVHEHWGDRLMHSSSIGGTHWQALGLGGGLPGPRPTLFFAPAQYEKRSTAPPQGLGAAALGQRVADAWNAFVSRVERSDDPWVDVVSASGSTATEAAYRALLDGRADPRQGRMLDLRG